MMSRGTEFSTSRSRIRSKNRRSSHPLNESLLVSQVSLSTLCFATLFPKQHD